MKEYFLEDSIDAHIHVDLYRITISSPLAPVQYFLLFHLYTELIFSLWSLNTFLCKMIVIVSRLCKLSEHLFIFVMFLYLLKTFFSEFPHLFLTLSGHSLFMIPRSCVYSHIFYYLMHLFCQLYNYPQPPHYL